MVSRKERYKKPRVLRRGSQLERALTVLDPEDYLVSVEGIMPPTTRADCVNGLRPCPWVGCRWHTYLHVSERGSIWIAHPERLPWEMQAGESCVLDLVEQLCREGSGNRLSSSRYSHRRIGLLFGLTKERTRQIEHEALRRLKSAAGSI